MKTEFTGTLWPEKLVINVVVGCVLVVCYCWRFVAIKIGVKWRLTINNQFVDWRCRNFPRIFDGLWSIQHHSVFWWPQLNVDGTMAGELVLVVAADILNMVAGCTEILFFTVRWMQLFFAKLTHITQSLGFRRFVEIVLCLSIELCSELGFVYLFFFLHFYCYTKNAFVFIWSNCIVTLSPIVYRWAIVKRTEPKIMLTKGRRAKIYLFMDFSLCWTPQLRFYIVLCSVYACVLVCELHN